MQKLMNLSGNAMFTKSCLLQKIEGSTPSAKDQNGQRDNLDDQACQSNSDLKFFQRLPT